MQGRNTHRKLSWKITKESHLESSDYVWRITGKIHPDEKIVRIREAGRQSSIANKSLLLKNVI